MAQKVRETTRSEAPRRKPGRIVVKLALVIVAVATLFLLAYMPSPKREVAPSDAPPVNVMVLPVTAEAQLPDTFDLPAVIEPNQIVTVAAEVAGRVEWIGPREGSPIKAGDLLLRLNTDLLQAEFESIQAQAKNDRTEFERQQGLVSGGASPTRELDQAATQLAISGARLQEVAARLERARISAPTSGVLNDLLVEAGEYVQVGTPVARIVQTDIVKVAVDIPERDVAFFATGQSAAVYTDIKGSPQAFEGKITFISRVADERTRSTRTEITLANPDGLLHSGQIVRARLTRQVLRNAILIPLLAVIPMENGYAVYVEEDSKALRREVQLQISIIKGDRIQVTSGLQPGDKLIVSGHRFVAPGQQVNVVSQISEGK
ncbi:MAG TPA: efflux RND transporter periplasmic adaptor subunit [Sedimentisphaerales bacterium]|jgi:membrane fusion protein (multidrug efflux system)|nr:efflux RND transporter periplasmic adaptor subunit [Sedimentisphaerales bacterium]HNU28102.1 efflux RND transporter periplasmic adaptor subunit [Sedimentisphaerales bacterium]